MGKPRSGGWAGYLAAQSLQRFQQQISSLAGIGATAQGTEQHQRRVGWQTQQRSGLGLIAGSPHVQVDRIGDHRDWLVNHQGAAPSAIGQPVAGAHDVNGPAPGAALTQPGAAVEVGPSFMGGAAGGAVAHREGLIAAGGADG